MVLIIAKLELIVPGIYSCHEEDRWVVWYGTYIIVVYNSRLGDVNENNPDKLIDLCACPPQDDTVLKD